MLHISGVGGGGKPALVGAQRKCRWFLDMDMIDAAHQGAGSSIQDNDSGEPIKFGIPLTGPKGNLITPDDRHQRRSNPWESDRRLLLKFPDHGAVRHPI